MSSGSGRFFAGRVENRASRRIDVLPRIDLRPLEKNFFRRIRSRWRDVVQRQNLFNGVSRIGILVVFRGRVRILPGLNGTFTQAERIRREFIGRDR